MTQIANQSPAWSEKSDNPAPSAVYTSRPDHLLPGVCNAYRNLWRRRPFIRFFVKSRKKQRLEQTLLQNFWLILEPLSQMLIYYFLVVIVFQRGSANGINPFVFIMLGIVHYLTFQEIITSSCKTIVHQRSMLMQIKIEPIVFVAMSFLSVLHKFQVSLVLYGLAYFAVGPHLSWKMAMYPLILGWILLLAWLFAVLLSTITVFIRDTDDTVKIILRILMYASPVIYPVLMVPDSIEHLYFLNPVACLFNLLQWSLLGMPAPPMYSIAITLGTTGLVFVLAHLTYVRLHPKFTKAF